MWFHTIIFPGKLKNMRKYHPDLCLLFREWPNSDCAIIEVYFSIVCKL